MNTTKKKAPTIECDIYDKKGEWAGLSNFSDHPVVYIEGAFKSSEHAFQAEKFRKTAPHMYFEIMATETPADAKKLGKTKSAPIDPNWDEIRTSVMAEIVTAKADQNKGFRDLLLKTNQNKITEKSPSDAFWGTGKDGKGKDHMGKILMQVRDELLKD